MTMKAWKNSREMLADMRNTLERLRAGQVDPERARVEASIFKAATKTLEVEVMHAKATGNLYMSGGVLPGIELVGGDE